MLESTSKFKVEEILYKDEAEGFAIARGKWNGGEEFSLACRWYVEDGLGYPQTFGKPQWMLLPVDPASVNIGNALSDPKHRTLTLSFGNQSAG